MGMSDVFTMILMGGSMIAFLGLYFGGKPVILTGLLIAVVGWGGWYLTRSGEMTSEEIAIELADASPCVKDWLKQHHEERRKGGLEKKPYRIQITKNLILEAKEQCRLIAAMDHDAKASEATDLEE